MNRVKAWRMLEEMSDGGMDGDVTYLVRSTTQERARSYQT